MSRGDVLPTKGFIHNALNFISLFLAKGGGDGGIQGSINIIGVFNGTLTKGALVGI